MEKRIKLWRIYVIGLLVMLLCWVSGRDDFRALEGLIGVILLGFAILCLPSLIRVNFFSGPAVRRPTRQTLSVGSSGKIRLGPLSSRGGSQD